MRIAELVTMMQGMLYFEGVNRRLDDLNEKLEKFDKRFDEIDETVSELGEHINTVKDDILDRADIIETRLRTGHEKVVERLDKLEYRMGVVQGLAEYEDYCRVKMMLHHPFVDSSEL